MSTPEEVNAYLRRLAGMRDDLVAEPASSSIPSGEIPAYRAAMDRMGQQLRETGHSAAQADSIVRACARRAHNQDGVKSR
jgi:hypothetical protein